MNKQLGVGLTEVLISLFLASFIMIILLNQYISVKRHYSTLQSTLADAMDLQFVIDLFQDSIHQAGFTPCMRIDHLITFDSQNGRHTIPAIDIKDGVTINRMSPQFDVMLNGLHSNQIEVTTYSQFHEGEPIIIADCNHAEILQLTDVKRTRNSQFLTFFSPVRFNYQPPVYVGAWWQERYFVRASKGLFYQREQTEELTSLVTNISTEMENNLVALYLTLKNGKRIELNTRVRAL